jgi:hypothetical protein
LHFASELRQASLAANLLAGVSLAPTEFWRHDWIPSRGLPGV